MIVTMGGRVRVLGVIAIAYHRPSIFWSFLANVIGRVPTIPTRWPFLTISKAFCIIGHHRYSRWVPTLTTNCMPAFFFEKISISRVSGRINLSRKGSIVMVLSARNKDNRSMAITFFALCFCFNASKNAICDRRNEIIRRLSLLYMFRACRVINSGNGATVTCSC